MVIDRISEYLGVTYEIKLPSDGGGIGKTAAGGDGHWSGIIGDILDRRVDAVVSEMSVTTERLRVVDFLVPYYEQSKLAVITVSVIYPCKC